MTFFLKKFNTVCLLLFLIVLATVPANSYNVVMPHNRNIVPSAIWLGLFAMVFPIMWYPICLIWVTVLALFAKSQIMAWPFTANELTLGVVATLAVILLARSVAARLLSKKMRWFLIETAVILHIVILILLVILQSEVTYDSLCYVLVALLTICVVLIILKPSQHVVYLISLTVAAFYVKLLTICCDHHMWSLLR